MDPQFELFAGFLVHESGTVDRVALELRGQAVSGPSHCRLGA